MNETLLTIAPERERTRLLMTRGRVDVLKAVLPSAELAHPRAAATLLEGLALWHQEHLSVVLLVDESPRCSGALALCDGLGFGERTLHYEVAVAVREGRRSAGRIDGLGSFRDLRRNRLEVIR